MAINQPSGLPDYGYSTQAAAIASALVQSDNAPVHRAMLRRWLDLFDDSAVGDVWNFDKAQLFAELRGWLDLFDDSAVGDVWNFDKAQLFAEYLTDLCRIGSGLEARG